MGRSIRETQGVQSENVIEGTYWANQEASAGLQLWRLEGFNEWPIMKWKANQDQGGDKNGHRKVIAFLTSRKYIPVVLGSDIYAPVAQLDRATDF